MSFKALLATKTDDKISASVVDMHERDLMPGALPVEEAVRRYLPAMRSVVEKVEGQFRQVCLQGQFEQHIQLAIGSNEHLGVEI
ncbi:hypothetical protein EMIT0196MI5_170069 [Pseudomonas sp. IT-196MI5]|uniref:hypothetical protein n=1 Tax=unclassified Pseudomonas TaxID=196821 RepID=UPI0039DFD079